MDDLAHLRIKITYAMAEFLILLPSTPIIPCTRSTTATPRRRDSSMPWMTTFVCEDVRFCIDEHPGTSCNDCACNEWSSVNISVHELGVGTPWLMVEKSGSKDQFSRPIIFRAMREGWKISSDEQTMTITMQGDEVEALAAGHQKLRFEKATDFWSLMYQISTSRLREYDAQSAAGMSANGFQADMEY